MIYNVETSHHCEQSLSGADVRCSIFALDVLFAGLEGETESLASELINADSDYTSRHFAFVLVGSSHESCVRSAESHRKSETLCVTNNNVSAPRCRRLEQYESHSVNNCSYKHFVFVCSFGELCVVADFAACARVLEDSTDIFLREFYLLVIANFNLDS